MQLIDISKKYINLHDRFFIHTTTCFLWYFIVEKVLVENKYLIRTRGSYSLKQYLNAYLLDQFSS